MCVCVCVRVDGLSEAEASANWAIATSKSRDRRISRIFSWLNTLCTTCTIVQLVYYCVARISNCDCLLNRICAQGNVPRRGLYVYIHVCGSFESLHKDEWF